MARVVRVVGAGRVESARCVDSVMLGAAGRRVQSGELTATSGMPLTLALSEPMTLRMGDALELEDGRFVEVVIEPEALIEIRGRDLTHLARLAWHLGDRHVPVQVLANRLRMRRDDALEAMLAGLGARLTAIEAPFDPEGGAYAAHHDAQAHGHDHAHHDHNHDHAHGHGHDHHHDHGHHHD